MTARAPSSRDLLLKAREAFEACDLEKALTLTSHCLRTTPDVQDIYDLAARILEKMEKKGNRDRIGLLFRLCHDRFNDAALFYKLGFSFMAMDMPHMARPILDRAFRLEPDNPNTRIEYAVALAETGDHAVATGILKDLDPDFSLLNPGIAFLTGWCHLLCGNIEDATGALDLLDSLRASPKFDPNLRERLHLGIERWRTAHRPEPNDLGAWHFLQYGSILLSESTLQDMGGRYGVLWESYEELAGRLAALVALLGHLEIPVKKVITPGQDDSEILGRTIAKQFHVRRHAFVAHEPVEPGTLFCAATIEDLVKVPYLTLRTRGLLVYVHRLTWTSSAPLTPDILGLMAEAHFFPWSRTMKLNQEDRTVVEQPRDRRPAEKIAEHLARLVPDTPPEAFRKRLDFFQQNRDLSLLAGDDRVTYRPPFRQESPVKSNRFGCI